MSVDAKNIVLIAGENTLEGYGLFVLDKSELQNEMPLVYFFDSDTFMHLKQDEVQSVVSPNELSSYTDEYGDVKEGNSLKAVIKEAIQAFNEELPGFIKSSAAFKERIKE